jgi:hypothetical protein
MTSVAEKEPKLAEIEARISYVVDTGVKPVTFTSGHMYRERKGTYMEHTVTIRDGRPLIDRFSLDREGFRFVRHDTRVKDFFDEAELRAVYYPEMVELVKRETGCARVVVFDHTLRSGDHETRETRKIREPVKSVHNDYTEWSGPQRVRDIMKGEAEELLKRRMLVVQVWRPINKPVETAPLAICDAQSMEPKDLVAAERNFPDRKGEIYQIAYNPKHRWYWFPKMRRDEALVFKCYDSLKDGRARFTAHTAFDNPDAPADAPPRESIEIRTLAFF